MMHHGAQGVPYPPRSIAGVRYQSKTFEKADAVVAVAVDLPLHLPNETSKPAEPGGGS